MDHTGTTVKISLKNSNEQEYKMKHGSFLIEGIKRFREVGTLVESTKFVGKAMAEEIKGSKTVVEFGAGTGPVTKEILKYLPEDGRLISFEINENLCKYLRLIEDPRLKVVCDDVRNINEYCDEYQCIVSGLPLAVFEEQQRQQIFDIIRKADIYVQLQYTPLLRKRFRKHFSDVRVKYVPVNIPPAFIYVCNHQDNGKN